MAELRFTNKAVEDLSSIWNYTLDTWSENQADLYYNMLIDYCREIAKNPTRGKTYQLIADGLFGIKAGKHIIFYRRLSDELIEIVRILHNSMDLKSRVLE